MIKMIELPYTLNSLEPYYNKETLDIHYNVLYKGYVDNTNKTQEKLAKARLENDFQNIKCLERDLAFFGSGAIYINYSLKIWEFQYQQCQVQN